MPDCLLDRDFEQVDSGSEQHQVGHLTRRYPRRDLNHTHGSAAIGDELRKRDPILQTKGTHRRAANFFGLRQNFTRQ